MPDDGVARGNPCDGESAYEIPPNIADVRSRVFSLQAKTANPLVRCECSLYIFAGDQSMTPQTTATTLFGLQR